MIREIRKHALIAALLPALMASPAAAGDAPPTLLPVEPVPVIGIRDPRPAAPAAPERFGFIRLIHPHCLVISDSCRGFSKDVIFRAGADGRALSRGALRVGDYVGFRFDEERRIEEIRLVEPPAGTR